MSRVISARTSAISSVSNASSSRPTSAHHDASETTPLLETGSGNRTPAELMDAVDDQKVYPLIHLVRNDLVLTIDTHLSWEELTNVDLNFSIVRPLALKYSRLNSLAILYVLLFNRVQFQREAEKDLAFQAVNQTRASLAELLACKLLRTFSSDGLELVTALTSTFSPFAGASSSTLESMGLKILTSENNNNNNNNNLGGGGFSGISLRELNGEGKVLPDYSSSALSLAIHSGAKKFIRTPLCQRCIDGIWRGHVVLSINSSHALMGDNYKRRPLSIYDPSKAPILDHYRLRVPRIRSWLEFGNFILLLLFFVLALGQKGNPNWTFQETIFSLWLCGFALDEFAQLKEHGLDVYSSSLFNLLDSLFCLISFSWFFLRIFSLHSGDLKQSDLSFDLLALGAVLLCPRVASTMVQDNVVLLALRAMFSDFVFFMALAIVIFSGFLYAFYSLSSREEWSLGGIAWLMLKIWFGSSYAGFDTAQSFSELLGPPLMVLFAVMSNTLLLTVLISLLSNTFMLVSMNAAEEVAYLHACKTFAGLTTDALFSYVPPLNLIGFIVIMPLSYVLSPRWLHKINVLLIRITSFPILLTIRFFQRHSFKKGLELTAEKASSWIPKTGKTELDIIERIFSLEEVESSFVTTMNDSREREIEVEEQLRSEDSPLEYGSRLSDKKEKKNHQEEEEEEEEERSHDDDDAHDDVADVDDGKLKIDTESNKTPKKSKSSSTSNTINNPSKSKVQTSSDNPSSTPPGPIQASGSSPACVNRGRNGNNGKRIGGRRNDANKGLGSLSSPLARLFGADRRSVSPNLNFNQRNDLVDSSNHNHNNGSHQHSFPHQSNNISKGTFKDDNQAEPHSESMNHVPRELIDRLELIEKRSERIEDLLSKIVENL